MTKRWFSWAAACALAALMVSLAGCAGNYTDPMPDQAYMPLTASWPGADAGPTHAGPTR
jgi:hypothetical protein